MIWNRKCQAAKKNASVMQERRFAMKNFLTRHKGATMNEQNDERYGRYEGEYSQPRFFAKLFKHAGSIGTSLLYKALQLFYVAQKPEVPLKVKATIYGALGYFVLPFDVVPDMIFGVGYGDDTTALLVALGIAHMYIDEEVREQAKRKLEGILGKKRVGCID